MTARQVFEAVLTELSKVKAPSLTLDEFNYYFNKAINLYVNKQYNVYDANLQTTDSCRVLKSSAQLIPSLVTNYHLYNDSNSNLGVFSKQMIENLYGATYEVSFPTDYLHLLNCICIFKLKELFKCWDSGSYVLFGATKLTADSWSTIITDFYNRPLPWRPYYYIHNVNNSNDTYDTDGVTVKHATLPTNGWNPDTTNNTLGSGTDYNGLETATKDNKSYVVDSDGKIIASSDSEAVGTEDSSDLNNYKTPLNLSLQLKIAKNTTGSLIEKTGGVRYGNASTVRCEIRYGKDNSVFELVGVIIDYLKAPQFIRLTQELVDLTKDTSQMMEFPDYVCQEIINELTHLVMERDADPRLQTNIGISTSIASPAQQLAAASSAS